VPSVGVKNATYFTVLMEEVGKGRLCMKRIKKRNKVVTDENTK
jgi:hypothetical protein